MLVISSEKKLKRGEKSISVTFPLTNHCKTLVWRVWTKWKSLYFSSTFSIVVVRLCKREIIVRVWFKVKNVKSFIFCRSTMNYEQFCTATFLVKVSSIEHKAWRTEITSKVSSDFSCLLRTIIKSTGIISLSFKSRTSFEIELSLLKCFSS